MDRREKGRNLKPNENPAKGERSKICPKLNASIVMNLGTCHEVSIEKINQSDLRRSTR